MKEVAILGSTGSIGKSALEIIKKSGEDWSFIEKVIAENKLEKIEYGNEIFYIRKFSIE